MSYLKSLFEVAQTRIAPALLAGAILSSPADARDQALALGTPVARLDNAKKQEPEYVDRFMVYAIDISKSVEDDEYRMMMKGMADAFRSEEMKMQLRQGLKFGVGTIFFCDVATFGVMEIIRTEEDAEYFADKAFWNRETDRPYDMAPCNHTNLSAPLEKAKELFARENELGFTALERTLVLLGDGTNNPSMSAKVVFGDNPVALSRNLATRSNAVVYGIPIIVGGDSGEDLIHFYRDLATPRGMYSVREDGYKVPLKEGRVTPSMGFDDVARATKETFMLNMF